jgi:hypothetical protein
MSPISIAPPIVIDLGKIDRGSFEALHKGNGRVQEEIAAVLQLVRPRVAQESGNRSLVAVVAVYREVAPRKGE